MKKIIFILFVVSFVACNTTPQDRSAPKVITTKSVSITGTWLYKYDWGGKEFWFEEKTDKYNVGDTLK